MKYMFKQHGEFRITYHQFYGSSGFFFLFLNFCVHFGMTSIYLIQSMPFSKVLSYLERQCHSYTDLFLTPYSFHVTNYCSRVEMQQHKSQKFTQCKTFLERSRTILGKYMQCICFFPIVSWSILHVWFTLVNSWLKVTLGSPNYALIGVCSLKWENQLQNYFVLLPSFESCWQNIYSRA